MSTFPPYQSHSDTSYAAAASVADKAPTMQAQVLALLRERGPMTDDELQVALGGIPSHSETPRRVALVRAGLVVDTGQRRKTRAGRTAVVWAAI